MFDTKDCPFDPNDISSRVIKLPSLNNPLGLVMKSDLVAGLPFIQSTTFKSPAYQQLQPGFRSNVYIITINDNGQFSAQASSAFIKNLQKEKVTTMTLRLVKR